MPDPRENISPADDLPKFPGSEEGSPSPTSSPTPSAKIEATPDVQELAKDLVTAGFEMAHAINPKIRELDEREKDNIGRPLAKVVVKYDLGKYLSYFSYVDEFMLVYNLGKAVTTRVKEVKDANNARSDGGPKREREDASH